MQETSVRGGACALERLEFMEKDRKRREMSCVNKGGAVESLRVEDERVLCIILANFRKT